MLSIITANRDQTQLLLDWAATEGWNPGIGDAGAFHAADPSGFLMGFYEGRPVTGISVVQSGAQFAFLGLYITHPEFRGRGFGWKTWQAGLERLGHKTIGLDGVVAQQANYAKSGFSAVHRSLRFTGKIARTRFQPRAVRPIVAKDFAKLSAFDAAHYGAKRPQFLQHWLNGQGGRRGFLVEQDGRICGYGVIRPCHAGFKIGPLFAERPLVAEQLLLAMMQMANGECVNIDVPEPNRSAVALLEGHGFRGAVPALPLEEIYGLTSFELG
jgi:ribosomal protein S18 acetylase RimI-like enzyme